ncbi:MAG: DedA family protein [Actinobacteria bacterium]|nr:DedA family protein [Actinomycetota bacterium]
MLGDLATWVESVIEKIGYLGVALLVGLESVIPVIPSEIVQPYAGFVARRDDMSVVIMVIVATIGSVVGSLIMYGIAAAIGPNRLHSFINQYGKWVGISSAELDKAERWFDRRANATVLFGRCVPLIRAVISIPAGFRRMKIIPFTIYTAIGSLMWNIFLIGAGALLGDQWDRISKYISVFQWVVILAIIVVLARFVISRVKRRRTSTTS